MINLVAWKDTLSLSPKVGGGTWKLESGRGSPHSSGEALGCRAYVQAVGELGANPLAFLNLPLASTEQE